MLLRLPRATPTTRSSTSTSSRSSTGARYRRRCSASERLRMLNVSRLADVEPSRRRRARRRSSHLPTGERTVLDADALVYATGYRPVDPTPLLGELAAHCRRDDAGPAARRARLPRRHRRRRARPASTCRAAPSTRHGITLLAAVQHRGPGRRDPRLGLRPAPHRSPAARAVRLGPSQLIRVSRSTPPEPPAQAGAAMLTTARPDPTTRAGRGARHHDAPRPGLPPGPRAWPPPTPAAGCGSRCPPACSPCAAC